MNFWLISMPQSMSTSSSNLEKSSDVPMPTSTIAQCFPAFVFLTSLIIFLNKVTCRPDSSYMQFGLPLSSYTAFLQINGLSFSQTGLSLNNGDSPYALFVKFCNFLERMSHARAWDWREDMINLKMVINNKLNIVVFIKFN